MKQNNLNFNKTKQIRKKKFKKETKMYYLFKSIIFYIIKDPDVDKRRPGPQH